MSILQALDTFPLIRHVSAPCGSGKTVGLCGLLADGFDDCSSGPIATGKRSHLYVAPTIKLLNEVESQLHDLGVDCIKITSEKHPRRTISEIMTTIKGLGSQGIVLLITHEFIFPSALLPST